MKVKVSKSMYDCFDESEIVCPFCGHRDEDSWELDLTENGEELECGNCGRSFIAAAEVTITYTTSPLDSANFEHWEVGDFYEDGCKEQTDEDWCNKEFYCEPEEK